MAIRILSPKGDMVLCTTGTDSHDQFANWSRNDVGFNNIKLGTPFGVPGCYLAAAAIAGIATATAEAAAAAVAQQEDQNDDPAHIATTVVIAHKNTSKKLFSRLSRSFHRILEAEICALWDRDF